MKILSNDELLKELFRARVITFETMTDLRIGLNSPVYVDLRAELYERPELLWALGRLFAEKILKVGTPGKKQKIIAVPDAAVPVAVAASLYAKIELGIDMPIIVLRKAPKEYGTQQDSLIIGNIESNAEYNLLDDAITSGGSIKKATEQLVKEGIKVNRVIVFADRQQGGKELLEKEGYEVYAIFRILTIAYNFSRDGLITDKQYEKVENFIENNQIK